MVNSVSHLDREQNYDLLRILSTISVILIHLGDDYGCQIIEGEPQYYFTVGNLCLTLTVYAVPCFLMLSGALLLSNPKNKNIKTFYKKSVTNLFVPTFIISALYVFYNIVKMYYHKRIGMDVSDTPLSYLYAWFRGEPFYHLWYMYMIIGIYLLVPFLIMIREQLDKKQRRKAAIVVLIISVVLWNTTSFSTHWGLESIVYLGYFLMGDVLRSGYDKDKGKKGNYNLFIGVALLFGYAVFREWAIRNNLQKWLFASMGNFHPIVMIASLQIFKGFVQLQVKKNVSVFAQKNFYIYLLHAGVIDVLYNVVPERWNPLLFIPFMLIATLIITYVASVILILVQNKMNTVHMARCVMVKAGNERF